MSVAITMPADDIVSAIESVLRYRIENGSKSFLAGSIAQECCEHGVTVTGTNVGRYFHNSPRFEQMKKAQRSWRWQLVEGHTL